MIDEDDDVLTERNDVRLPYASVQRKIKLSLQMFEETVLERRIEVTMERIGVSWFDTIEQGAAKKEKPIFYQAREHVACRAVSSTAVNEFINTKVYRLAESWHLVQHPTINLVKDWCFAVSITHLVK